MEAVTKHGIDKLKDAGREDAPFELIVDEGGTERRYVARAVIDASGTWTRPNPLGARPGSVCHLTRTVPHLVNTSPDIADDACNYAWMEFLRHQPERDGSWKA